MDKEVLIKTQSELDEIVREEFINYHLNLYNLKYIEKYESDSVLFEDPEGNKFYVMVKANKQGGYNFVAPDIDGIQIILNTLGKERMCFFCPFYIDGLKEKEGGIFTIPVDYKINYVHAISFNALYEDSLKAPKDRLIKNNSKKNKNGYLVYTWTGVDEVIRREFVNLIMKDMHLSLDRLYGLDSLIATKEDGKKVFLILRACKMESKTQPIPEKFILERIQETFGNQMECYYLPIFVEGMVLDPNGLKLVPPDHKLTLKKEIYTIPKLLKYYEDQKKEYH